MQDKETLMAWLQKVEEAIEALGQLQEGLPDVKPVDNGKILQVIQGEWALTKALPDTVDDLEGDVGLLQTDVQTLNRKMDEIYDGLLDMRTSLNDILRGAR